MEGPRPPGYYPSVTGVRPPGEVPGQLPRRGPVALVGEVHRYGPKQAKLTYFPRVLLGLGLPDVELVWRGPERGVPTDVGSAEWTRVMAQCQREAEAEADRLDELDPRAHGGVR